MIFHDYCYEILVYESESINAEILQETVIMNKWFSKIFVFQLTKLQQKSGHFHFHYNSSIKKHHYEIDQIYMSSW